MAIPYDWQKWCRECNVPEPERLHGICLQFFTLLVEANSYVNLTRIADEDGFWIKHVLDSLLPGKFFPELSTEVFHIADVGCGAGFPSLVLAAAYPNLKVTAIDSVGKKTKFVESTAKTLGLSNVTVLNGRSPELNRRKEYENRYDILTARAVGDAVKLYTEADHMVKSSGRYLFYKTPEQAREEISRLQQLKGKKSGNQVWSLTDPVELPMNAGSRVFLIGKM